MTDLNPTPNNRLVLWGVIGPGDIIAGLVLIALGLSASEPLLAIVGAAILLCGVILTFAGRASIRRDARRTPAQQYSERGTEAPMSAPERAESAPLVTRNDESQEYEIRVGGALAGIAAYRLRPGQILFTHTQIDPAFGGQGLGGILARAVLDDAVAQGLTIVPYCPFIQDYLRKHPDFAGTVDWPEDPQLRAD